MQFAAPVACDQSRESSKSSRFTGGRGSDRKFRSVIILNLPSRHAPRTKVTTVQKIRPGKPAPLRRGSCARHRGGSTRATTRHAPTRPRRSPQARTTELMIAQRSKSIAKATRSTRLQGCTSSGARDRLALTVGRRRGWRTCSSRMDRAARGSQQASRVDSETNGPTRPKSSRPPTTARLPSPPPEQQSVERCRQQQLHVLRSESRATSGSRSAAPKEQLSSLAARSAKS